MSRTSVDAGSISNMSNIEENYAEFIARELNASFEIICSDNELEIEQYIANAKK